MHPRLASFSNDFGREVGPSTPLRQLPFARRHRRWEAARRWAIALLAMATCVAGASAAPVISAIANQTVNEDTVIGPIPFTIGDATTPAAQLRLSATSTTPGLFPVSAISFGGGGSNRTVTLRPVTNAFGSATITIAVSNATEFASRAFVVQVNAVNDPPTLDPIPDQGVYPSGGGASVFLWGITSGAGNENQTLTVTVVSNSNPALFDSQPSVFYTSPSSSGSLSFRPTFNALGVATLVVQVNDGGASNNIVRREFRVAVTNHLVDLGAYVWSAFPFPAGVSNVLTYNLRVQNQGPTNATAVLLTSVLPTNTVFLSARVSGAPGVCQHAGGVVTCQFATLPLFRGANVRLQVLPVSEGTATNFVSVTSAQWEQYPLDNSTVVTTPVIRAADLGISGPDLPEAVLLGSNLTATLQVTNQGLLTATNARIQFYFSEDVQILLLATSLGSCSNIPGGAECVLGNLAVGGSARITVTARPQSVGEVYLSASAQTSTPEVQSANNYWNGITVAARSIVRAASTSAVQIPTQGTASPYPSTLQVSGLTARVQRVTVTLHGLTHPVPADLDVLLVGPTGRGVLLLSDYESLDGATNVTLTFGDAYSALPFGESITSGFFVPTDYEDLDGLPDSFPPPAPGTRPSGALEIFNDSNGNGTWSLYIVDDSASGGGGVLAGGWSLTVAVGSRSLIKPASFRALATGRPSTGSGGLFSQLAPPVLNAAGQVAFLAESDVPFPGGGTESVAGIWTASAPQDVRKLAGRGDLAPGLGENWQFQIHFDFEPVPALNDAGLIGFGALAFDPEEGFERFALWSGTSSNDLDYLALGDGPAPVAGADWVFTELSRPFLSASGVMAFRGRAEDIFLADSFAGYWLGTSRSNLALLARDGQPAPGVDGDFFEFPEIDFTAPVLDAAGRLAFVAAAQTDFDTVPGIWIGSSAQNLRPIALGGMSLPGLPRDLRLSRDTFSWRLLGIDSAGRVYFRAEVNGDYSPSFSGIFAGTDPADLQLLFRTDTPVFVGPMRVVFTSFECAEVTPDGEVIFLADFQDPIQGSVPGLWKGHAADDLQLVAYDGQRLPGVSERAVLRNLNVDCPVRGVSRFGRLVFRASIVEEPQGNFYEALLAHDPVAGVVPLVRSGEFIELAPGDVRRIFEFNTVSSPGGFGLDRSGGRQAFNDAGELAFRAYFEDDTTAIVIAQLGSASVEGDVWYDRTANAVQDTGEPGVPRTGVELFSPGADGQPGGGDDVLVASRLTDANGHYRLGTMTAGLYFLQFTPPPGFGFVARDQGGDDTRDSDADPATGRTAVFTLGPTTRDTSRSAGLVSGFAVVDSEVTEGDTGTRELRVTIALGVPRRFPVSVSYATASGTATSGLDFTPASGTLTFNPGESTKTFPLLVIGDTLPENDETVLIHLSNPTGAPIVRAPGAGRILNDDPVPPPPSQPQPPDRSILQPLNLDLTWKATRTRELLTNGGFELGSFSGWTVEPAGPGYPGFYLVEDSLSAPEGRYHATANEGTSQARVLSRRVVLPGQLVSARLRWWQNVRPHVGLGGGRQFRVEVRDESRQTLAVVYQAGPGDNFFQWEQASADLRPFGGRTIEIAFILEGPSFDISLDLDGIRVEVDDTAGTTFDVYLGTRPVPGAGEFRGNTAPTFWPAPGLAPLTTYYWQIVARRGEASVPGPVWRFTTRRNVTNDFAHTFSSLDEILVPNFGEDGRAWPYPSTITVRHLPGAVAKATVTLHGLSHSYPEDLDVLLVGPDGRRSLLLSDAGGSNAVTGLTLTFDDAAPAPVAPAGPLRSGTFRPADYPGWPDDFPPPAPAGPHPASLARFGEGSPNGTWSLYVFDGFSFEDGGAIAEGWTLSLTLLQADSDSDGLPDDYEMANELNPLDRRDGAEDVDEDGHTRAQEYLAGTYYEDAESVLRIRQFYFEGNDVVLEISTGIDRDFRLERLASLTGPPTVVAELPGVGERMIVRDFGARLLPRAFYRVRAVTSLRPFDPEFPPGPEYFRAQSMPLANTGFTRLFAVQEDGFSQRATAFRVSPDALLIEGREGDFGDGFFVERFQIFLPGVLSPGEFAISPAGPATATYSRAPFPGPPFGFATGQPGDGGTVAIDSLENGIASGRFNLILSDTAVGSRKIRASGSFRAFIE